MANDRNSNFLQNWPLIPTRMRLHLKTLAKHAPIVQRNAAYCTGYLGALMDSGMIESECYTYCLALIGALERQEKFFIDAVRYAIR